MTERRCDCEPKVWEDGSLTHDEECAAFPWCPHEVVAYACLMPCRCRCAACAELTTAAGLADKEQP